MNGSLGIIGVSCCAWNISGVAMLTRFRILLGMLASMLVAGNAFAVSKEAQEFMSIQSKMAPDQCELQRLSSQAAAAQRAGDRGKRIPVSYTHLRAHETRHELVCRLLLEKNNSKQKRPNV